MRELAHRHHRRHRRGRCPHTILTLTMLGLGSVGFAALGRPTPVLIYNASASAPIGFYGVLPAEPLHRGDYVLARTPDSVRRLAADRHYLPEDVPLVKRVAALGGDTVCAVNRAVTIDGRYVATQLTADRLGRPLPGWTGCMTLRLGEIFLLMQGVPDSFDGRYFGPVSSSTIIGRLVPLWVR